MLKILIVDDEVFVRLGIRNTIDWKSIGYEVVGEAEDGLGALEIARETRPDVVLTDINMPKMNGLKLIGILKEEMPKTKVIVLSCYNDYEYVREAMQLYGALDYLLKLSMQPDDLVKVMENVKKIIEEERKKSNESMEFMWQLNSNKYDLKEKLLNESVDSKYSDISRLANQQKLIRFYLGNCFYTTVSIRLDSYWSIRNGNILGDFNLFKFSFLNVTEEIIEGADIAGDAFYRHEDEFVLLLGSRDVNSLSDNRVLSLCRELLSAYKTFLSVSASFGIGSAVNPVSQLYRSYSEASAASSYKLYYGKGSITHVKNFEAAVVRCYFDSGKEELLREMMENNRIYDAKKIIHDLINKISVERCLSPKWVLEEIKEILNTFSSIIRQYNGSMFEIYDENGNNPYESIKQCDTLDEMKQWFGWFAEKFGNSLETLKSLKFSREIQIALDYIQTHYMEDIKLKDIAKLVHISEAYLSILFKKETEEYFTDYLNQVRIDKAKYFFKKDPISVTEVGAMVGYASTSYFSRAFKQFAGMSPAEYKKSIKML